MDPQVARTAPLARLAAARARAGLPVAPASVAERKELGAEVSTSRMRLEGECPRAYGFRYHQKLPGRETPRMAKGTLLHGVLERAGRHAMATGEFETPTPGQLKAWLEEQASLTSTSARTLREALATLKDVAPLLDFRTAVALEEAWTLDLELDPALHPRALATGVFDRLDEDDGGWDGYTVYDYKTGLWVPTDAEIVDDEQVLLYLAAARRLLPAERPVRAVFWYLVRGVRHVVEWSPERDEQALSAARAWVVRVRATTTWPAYVGPACVECPYTGRCAPYQASLKQEHTPITVASEGHEELLETYHRSARLVKLHEADKKAVGQVLLQLCEASGGSILGRGLRAHLVTQTRTRLPELDHACQVIEQAFLDAHISPAPDAATIREAVVGLDARRLDAYLEGFRADVRDGVRDALKAVGDQYVAATYVDVRPLVGPF